MPSGVPLPKRLAILLEMLLSLLVLLWAGCSPEKHYATLSLFFDDPPKPAAPTAGPVPPTGSPSGGHADGDAQGLRFVHQPYREGKCQSCHGDKDPAKMQMVGSATCMSCHEAVVTKYPVMHRAVTDKACLWCHAPHESTLPALLRTTAPALCLQCHDSELLHDACGGAHLAQADCMECHAAHGGKRGNLLLTEAQRASRHPLVPAGSPLR